MEAIEKNKRLTVQEYLALEEAAEYRSEYYEGEIFAMSGGTMAHSKINSNVIRALGNLLAEKDCTVFDSNLKLQIESAKSFVYPDVMVVCGKPELSEDRKDIILNPILVVEVLSKSTAAFDRGGKFHKYRTIPSLREYMIIEQETSEVDVFYKNDEGQWIFDGVSDLKMAVTLRSLDIKIPMADIYHKVEFESEETTATES